MSFHSATNTDIRDCSFTEVAGSQTNIYSGPVYYIAHAHTMKRQRSPIPDTSMDYLPPPKRYRKEIASYVHYEDILPQMLLRTSSGYQVHSALLGGRVVAVKVFNGQRAQQNCRHTELFHRHVMHPNLLHLSAVSRPDANTHFIVFDGAFRGSVERILASALHTDLTRSILLGMQMIQGLASGLDYLCMVGVPLDLVGIENYDIFVHGDNRVIIGIDPIQIDNINSGSHCDSHTAWGVFSQLCRDTFRAANSVLYRDLLDRDEASTDILAIPSQNSVEHQPQKIKEGKASLDPADITPQKPRRELVWKSLGQRDFSLGLPVIAQQFGDFLDVIYPDPSGTLLQRRLASNTQKVVHRCPGYNREEITLTASIYDSAVISHRTPSVREVCIVCGTPVQEDESFSCECGEEDDGFRPTIKCTNCSTWHHMECIVIQGLGLPAFVCQHCLPTYTQLQSHYFSTHMTSPTLSVRTRPRHHDPSSNLVPKLSQPSVDDMDMDCERSFSVPIHSYESEDGVTGQIIMDDFENFSTDDDSSLSDTSDAGTISETAFFMPIDNVETRSSTTTSRVVSGVVPAPALGISYSGMADEVTAAGMSPPFGLSPLRVFHGDAGTGESSFTTSAHLGSLPGVHSALPISYSSGYKSKEYFSPIPFPVSHRISDKKYTSGKFSLSGPPDLGNNIKFTYAAATDPRMGVVRRLQKGNSLQTMRDAFGRLE